MRDWLGQCLWGGKGQAGSWRRWGCPSEPDAGLTPGKERGKADGGVGRKGLRLQPRMRKFVVRSVGSPVAQTSHRGILCLTGWGLLVTQQGSGTDWESPVGSMASAWTPWCVQSTAAAISHYCSPQKEIGVVLLAIICISWHFIFHLFKSKE